MTRRFDPSHRAYLALAIPNILTNLTVPVAGLVDLALLGHLDQVEALGGVALGTVFFDYLYWTFGFLRMSTTALAAKAFGARDPRLTRDVMARACLVAASIGLTILVAQTLLIDAGFTFLQGEKQVEDAGLQYVHARIWGAPAALSIYVIHGYLLGRQKVRAALLLAALLNGANIVLDVWFIGFLGWGTAGAGLATMLSEWLAVGFGVFLVSRDWPSVHEWRLANAFQITEFKRLFGLQGNIMVRTFCLVSSFALFTNISALLGTLFLTASAILLKLLGVASFFIDGYAFALESLAGAYAGAKRLRALRRSYRVSLFWNLLSVVAFILVFSFFGRTIIAMLTQHEEVIVETLKWIPWLCAVLLFSGFAYILDGLFIGLAAGKRLRNSMLIATGLGFLPFAWWSWKSQSPVVLWVGLVSFMVMRTLTLGWCAERLFRKPRSLID